MGNMPATVIGVADEKQSMFGSSKILRVWLPYTTMAGRVMGQSWLNSITVRVHEGYDSETAEKQLLRLLELRHGKKDVFTWNMDSVLKTAERTTHTLQLFLTLVAVIALVVGGIGVMNIMLVSVTERTRRSASAWRLAPGPAMCCSSFSLKRCWFAWSVARWA